MSDNGVRHERGASTPAAQRLAAKSAQFAERRALNTGSGDTLAKAFEIALTPVIMAGLGWLLDRWLGTTPVFLVGFAVFTFVYVVWKAMRGYDSTMRDQEADLRTRVSGKPS